MTHLTLGFLPLTDCAPLIAAQELGLFASHGLDVRLSREASWATVRDKLAAGALDAAHMLAGMPLASTLGLAGLPKAMMTGLCLAANGNCITVSKALFERMAAVDPDAAGSADCAARALKAVIKIDRAAERPGLVFAMTFPWSTHNLEVRLWLSAAGIDPDQDARLIVTPPPRMVEALGAGAVDGFCVGEPWNAVAVDRDLGRIVATKHDLMPGAPEKVLGVTVDWAEANPDVHQALIMALLHAARWCDEPANRASLAELLAQPEFVGAPLETLRRSLVGELVRAKGAASEAAPDFHLFFRHGASRPRRDYAEWTLAQMQRWGQISQAIDRRAVAAAVYRPDLHWAAAAAAGLAAEACPEARPSE